MKVEEKLNIKPKVEHKTLELKAKVDDLEVVRAKLTKMKAQRVGKFRQTDVYFNVPEGRLKLREVDGYDRAELIYYERENIAAPKTSDVFILKIQKPAFFKELLKKLLKISVIVRKQREIYRYQGPPLASRFRYVQIHFDDVENLGTFIEFEMKTSDQRKEGHKKVLEKLMNMLSIKTNQLEEHSYSDLSLISP